MKIKVFFIGIVMFLLGISLLQIFPVPPFAERLYPVYESGYFRELREQQQVVAEAFLAVKQGERAEMAWLFLKELKKDHDIKAEVYNSYGYRLAQPGNPLKTENVDLVAKIKRNSKKIYSEVSMGHFSSLLPLVAVKKCRFCHRSVREGDIVGFLHVSQPCDAHIYYTGERILLFTGIAFFLSVILFFLFKWEPEGKIKEMFDKS